MNLKKSKDPWKRLTWLLKNAWVRGLKNQKAHVTKSWILSYNLYVFQTLLHQNNWCWSLCEYVNCLFFFCFVSERALGFSQDIEVCGWDRWHPQTKKRGTNNPQCQVSCMPDWQHWWGIQEDLPVRNELISIYNNM